MGFEKVKFDWISHKSNVFMIIYSSIDRQRTKTDDFQDNMSSDFSVINLHEKEELDAAEALTFLAGNCKNRWVK